MKDRKETQLSFLKYIDPQKIIAVTKNHTIQAAEQAIKLNIYKIGENRVQEAINKYESFDKRKKIELHLIGPLQTNKIKKAIKTFDVIQTVAKLKTLNKTDAEAKKINKKQTIYIQINISKDIQKKGMKENEIKNFCKQIKEKKNIVLKGVMVILKNNATKKETRKMYKKTKKIQEKIKKTLISTCEETSMGMSKDYQTALEEGATQIRLGTILFGKRK